jgi:hypothetical protein
MMRARRRALGAVVKPMPSEAISLALAASIYPPALAAVIALGRGTQVRLRVLLLVFGAFFTVLFTGALMLLLFSEVSGSSATTRTVGSGLYIAGGVALVVLGFRLLTRPPKPKPKQDTGQSKTDKYLESTRLVLLLGFILYVVPSPIYMGVVKAIADTNASTAQQIGYLVISLLIMLWLIEIPMLILLIFPAGGAKVLENINAWFARNGRRTAAYVSILAGVYLAAVGLIEIL